MTKNINFISVIIPCLNNETTIEKCIISLLRQDYPSNFFEIILVDNGSSDKTISIIQKYPVRLLKEKIKNPYIARNKGALYAKGQILAFTDANCEIDKSWLMNINYIMNTNVDASQGPGFLTNQKGLLPKAESKRLFMDGTHFWGDAKNLAIKKEIFNEVNGFLKYPTGCDALLVHQLKSLNYSVKYNENQLVYREFSEQFIVLMKKNWKYGKGDVLIDMIENDLKKYIKTIKYKKMKRMVALTNRFCITIMKSKTKDDLLMNIYIYLTLEVRTLSYFLNLNAVLLSYEHELRENKNCCF
jgi:glycosyltransferase involved in cell wall biosynthesis